MVQLLEFGKTISVEKVYYPNIIDEDVNSVAKWLFEATRMVYRDSCWGEGGATCHVTWVRSHGTSRDVCTYRFGGPLGVDTLVVILEV